jgi:hypothetical protein
MPLFMFSAFRNGLGTDYYAYADYYNYPEILQNEFLFQFLFITVPRLISHNARTFFLLTSFIVSFYFLKTIFRYSQIVPLSLVIYISQFYFSSYNVVRQFVAIAIFIYFGSKFINEKRLVLYCLLVVLLAQIHYSMYFMLVFPFLGSHDYRINKYWLIWLSSFLLVFLQSYNIIDFSTIFRFAPRLMFLSDKFDVVVDASNYFYGTFTSNLQLIFKNLFCIAFLCKLKYFKGSSQIYWFNLFLFGVILHNILFKYSLYAVRISYIGDVALLILVPFYIKTFKAKINRFALIIFFALYFSYSFYYRFVALGESGVFGQGL